MTNTAESALHYPLAERLPAPLETLELAPGIRWIRMALPFALDHINLWLLRDSLPDNQGVLREGWTVVDCCVDRPSSREQWEHIFTHSLEGLPILRVLATHMHPDHIGLAHWICERWQAPLWISATDYYSARGAIYDKDGFGGESGADFYRMHGMDNQDFLQHVRGRSNYYATLVPALPGHFRRMLDGDQIKIGEHNWQCISGYGHAPEHIALYCQQTNILISGDMVLPRISANVSVHSTEPEANPLKLFMSSLKRYFDLPSDALVLPSHGKPFKGVHTRVKQLLDHHEERLEDILLACQTQSLSAADAVPILFKRALDTHQMTFALGEALAHLHYLWFADQLQRTQDKNGVFRFSR